MLYAPDVLCKDAEGLGRNAAVQEGLENAASKEAERLATDEKSRGNVLKAVPNMFTHTHSYMFIFRCMSNSQCLASGAGAFEEGCPDVILHRFS